MIDTLRFYWDNIKRFEKHQLFYMILHRTRDKIGGIIRYKSLRKIPDDSLINLRSFESKLSNTLFWANRQPVWDLFETDKTAEIPYFKDLKSNINRNLTFPVKLWKTEHDDLEISNNYDRFYLFLEAFIELETTPDDAINVLINFIEMKNKKIDRCWNGFNITIRIINWLKILAYYSKDLKEEDWLIIQRSLFEHFNLLKSKIEKHIPGNHILYQYFVLSLISILFPKWETDKDWDELVIKEINKQFLNGGLHFELGYHYHIQTTIAVLFWYYIIQRSGKKIPPDIGRTIQQSVGIIDKFILPDGTVPMIGDNCFSFFHQKLKEDIANIRFLSSDLFDFSNTTQPQLSDISNSYLISDFSDSKLILDVGELGYRSNPGHGHSDLLGVIYYQRAPVFIDPGTRKYQNSGKSKNLKKSILHNTLTINTESQADLGSFFRWAYLPEKLIHYYKNNGNEHILSGSYIGFKQLGSFKHYRKIAHKNDFMEIEDNVPGIKTVDIELNFVLHQDISIDKKETLLILNDQKHFWSVQFISEEKFSINILPVEIFLSYNQGIPSHRINILFSDIKLPFTCKTIIVPI